MRRILAGLVALAALAFGGGLSAPASAQEPVAVSGAVVDGKPRLVFDWQTPAGFAAEVFDGQLIVRFSRPFQGDLAAAAKSLAPFVADAQIRPDLRTAVFTLRGDKSFRTAQTGGRVTIDLVDRDQAAAEPQAKPQTRPPAQPQARLPAQPQVRPPVQPQAQPQPRPPAASQAQAKPEPEAELPVARVRLGDNPAGTRLEIDWDRPVKVATRENGRNVTYQFAVPARLDLGDLKDRALDLVEGIDAAAAKTGPTLSLTLSDKARARSSQDGNRFILDIEPAAGKPPAKTAGVAAPPAAQSLPADPAPAEPAKPKETPTALATPPATPPASPPPASPPAAEPVASGPVRQAALAVGMRAANDRVTLSFPWNQPVAAAAFRRGDQIWIVFDGETKLDLQRVLRAPKTIVAGAMQLPHEEMTVLRVAAANPVNPTLTRDGNGWSVEIRHQPMQPEAPIAVEPRRGADGTTVLSLAVDRPGRVARLRDPDIGDRLIVVPVPTAGQGVAGQRDFAEFRLLGSVQGVAVEPIADDIQVTAQPGEVTIGAKGGLMLSTGPAAEHGAGPSGNATAAAPAGPRLPPEAVLFDFPGWSLAGKGDFTSLRRQKNLELAAAPPEARTLARIDNARFYFANLLPQEALGALDLLEADGVPEAGEPQFKALKGATQALARKFADAAATLADPRLDGNREATLWRGLVAAQRNDLAKANELFLAAGQSAPDTYPMPLRQEFGLKAVEATLATKNPKLASTMLDGLSAIIKDGPNKGQLDFLRANILAANGKWGDAMKLWHEVATRRELPSWPRAEMALIEQGLATRTLKPANAIERLEKLRYVWRGDDLERRVLEMLAQLNLEVGENAAGLQLYRELATLFPDSPEARSGTEAMSKAFARLFVDGEADAMPPLKALSLYDSYRELTPSGAKGDELIRKLADRVAAIDLLDRAGELLEDLVKRRLKGDAKGEAGTRLAQIRLQNGQPDLALQALDESQVDTLSDPIKRDRNRLRAEALFAQNKPAEALAQLQNDESEAADRLRQDIHWKQADWAKAAKVALRRADRLAPGKGKPSDEAAGVIMNAAVAASLANDKQTLAQLRERFGAAMDQTGQKSAFRLIANGGGTPTDLADIQRALDAAQNFQKSLANTKPAAGQPQPKTN